jgi:hypothetical protein
MTFIGAHAAPSFRFIFFPQIGFVSGNHDGDFVRCALLKTENGFDELTRKKSTH